jgi:hypothetical protein
LKYGKAIGYALDEFFDAWIKRIPTPEAIQLSIDAFLRECPEDLDPKRTVSTAKAIIHAYYSHWWDYPIDRIIGSEVPLSIDFGDFEMWGKLDKIFDWQLGITAMDHKTTSYWLSNFMGKIRDSHQFTGYIAILMQLHGSSANRMLVDAIFIPTPNTKGEITRRDGTSMLDFDRQTTNRTPMEVEEWKDWVEQTVDHIKTSEANERFVQNKSACWNFNRKCPYYEACESFLPCENAAKWMLDREADYRVEEWKPWD